VKSKGTVWECNLPVVALRKEEWTKEAVDSGEEGGKR